MSISTTWNIFQVHDQLPVDDYKTLGFCRNKIQQTCQHYAQSNFDPLNFDSCVNQFVTDSMKTNFNCSLWDPEQQNCQLNTPAINSNSSNILDKFHGKCSKLFCFTLLFEMVHKQHLLLFKRIIMTRYWG